MTEIQMKSVQATRYDVVHQGETLLVTFDYDRASQTVNGLAVGRLAPCSDCRKVVEVPSVQYRGEACPQSTSDHYPGHRVSREDYETWESLT